MQVDFPNKERKAIVFCVEENTRKPELWRHAVYVLLLSDLLKTKRVVPVAIHPRGKKPAPETLELKGDHGTYLQFKVLTTTLSQLNASDYKDSNNRVELLCMPRMKYTKSEKLDIVESCVHGFFKNEPDIDLRIKYSQLIAYQMALTPEDEMRLRQRAERRPELEKFMSYGEVLTARGVERGKIELIVEFCKSGLITVEKARQQLEKLAAEEGLTKKKLREALKQLPK